MNFFWIKLSVVPKDRNHRLLSAAIYGKFFRSPEDNLNTQYFFEVFLGCS